MSTPTWADIAAWAKREIETGRTALEAATDHSDIIRIQARIAVMRHLLTLNKPPAAPELPPSISYT